MFNYIPFRVYRVGVRVTVLEHFCSAGSRLPRSVLRARVDVDARAVLSSTRSSQARGNLYESVREADFAGFWIC